MTETFIAQHIGAVISAFLVYFFYRADPKLSQNYRGDKHWANWFALLIFRLSILASLLRILRTVVRDISTIVG